MSKFIVDLSTSLLDGLRKDCLSYYQDEATEVDRLFRYVVYASKSIDGMVELSRIGKSIEISLITGNPLSLPCCFLNQVKPGTCLPSAGYFLFSRVFHCVTKEPLIQMVVNGKKTIYKMFEPEDLSCEPSYVDPVPGEALQPLAHAAWLLRQIFLIFSKREDIPTVAEESEEVEAFISRVTAEPNICLERHVVMAARRFLREVFTEDGQLHCSIEQWLSNPYGKHGPGAVYDGSKGTAKWEFSKSMNDLGTHREFVDPTSDEPLGPPKNRLCVVPKDFRKHRLICIEQKEQMFQQQGFRNVLEFIMAQNPLTARCISFDDQTKNFKLSKRLDYSTLDLSDASDLLSLRLCKLLFPSNLMSILLQCRSAHIELPDSSLIKYKSMYTMGNALCFTIESVVFAALTAATISVYSGMAVDKATRNFRVFGDDIIVKNEYAEPLCAVLRSAGLKPNLEKCCTNSIVRESCGSWFVHGIDIRILRPKTMTVSNDRDWIAALQMSKNLAESGCQQTAYALLQAINEYYPAPFGFFNLPGDKTQARNAMKAVGAYRWDLQFQREEFYCPTQKGDITSMKRLQGRNGHKGIYAYFTSQATKSFTRLITERSWTALE